MEKENKNKVLIIPTSNVLRDHEHLVGSVRQAVHDVSTKIQRFEPEIIIAGNTVADEYSEHEKDAYNHEREQIDVDKYSSVLFKNTNILGPERIPTIILTDKDMNYENRETNFVFGVGWGDSLQLSVQSINRIIKATDDKISQSSLANYLARHEYGHMLGLNRSNYAEPDKRGGIYKGHCGADACTMNQVTSISEIIALVEKLDGNSDKLAGFCAGCVAKLRENRKKIKNPNRVFKEIKPKNPNRVFEEIK